MRRSPFEGSLLTRAELAELVRLAVRSGLAEPTARSLLFGTGHHLVAAGLSHQSRPRSQVQSDLAALALDRVDEDFTLEDWLHNAQNLLGPRPEAQALEAMAATVAERRALRLARRSTVAGRVVAALGRALWPLLVLLGLVVFGGVRLAGQPPPGVSVIEISDESATWAPGLTTRPLAAAPLVRLIERSCPDRRALAFAIDVGEQPPADRRAIMQSLRRCAARGVRISTPPLPEPTDGVEQVSTALQSGPLWLGEAVVRGAPAHDGPHRAMWLALAGRPAPWWADGALIPLDAYRWLDTVDVWPAGPLAAAKAPGKIPVLAANVILGGAVRRLRAPAEQPWLTVVGPPWAMHREVTGARLQALLARWHAGGGLPWRIPNWCGAALAMLGFVALRRVPERAVLLIVGLLLLAVAARLAADAVLPLWPAWLLALGGVWHGRRP